MYTYICILHYGLMYKTQEQQGGSTHQDEKEKQTEKGRTKQIRGDTKSRN